MKCFYFIAFFDFIVMVLAGINGMKIDESAGRNPNIQKCLRLFKKFSECLRLPKYAKDFFQTVCFPCPSHTQSAARKLRFINTGRCVVIEAAAGRHTQCSAHEG